MLKGTFGSAHQCIWSLLVAIFCLTSSAGAYKVLVVSTSMSKSHLISNAKVADALAWDGHNVTLLEIEYQVPLNTLNASKLARVWRIPGQFFRLKIEDGGNGEEITNFQRLIVQMSFSNKFSLFSQFLWHRRFFSRFMNVFYDACENLITTERDQLELLKAEKFDLIFGEQFDFCSAGLSHVLEIPTYILLNSCPIQENIASIIGLPSPSSWVPTVDSDASDKMSLLGRLRNFVFQMSTRIAFTGMDTLNAIFRKHFGDDFPDVLDIVKQSPFIFVNVDEFVDFPRPLFSNIVYIGGLGLEEKTTPKLEEPFHTEMAKGARGVILFSLGSIVRSDDLPESFRRNIFKAFAAFPDYHFIVKAEREDNVPHHAIGSPTCDNVFLASWLPQVDLLNHPRLRLFISHGGYNSLMEVARAGVPLIAMGFFADQYRNARVAERNGWAKAFDKSLLLEDSEQFKEAIGQVLGDERYATNAKRIQRLIQTKPFSAHERLVKSIRFLEQNGGRLPELLPESRNMGTMALYNLDLLLIASAVVIVLLAAICLVTKRIWRFTLCRLRAMMGGTKKNKAE